MSEWISVQDRLPVPGERVLIATHKFVGEGYLGYSGPRKEWMRFDLDVKNYFGMIVTHWMPLPEPPEV